MLDLRHASHRRFNPLTGEWVLVSPHRTQRPWQGKREAVPAAPALEHDPDCYLCAGNTRANGARNPGYKHTFVFDNDFAALQPGAATDRVEYGLLLADGESGRCRVLCYSPRHDTPLANMTVPDIERVVDEWVEETMSLGAEPDIAYVQIFENRGEIMGCSNPHPHGQIWASRHPPNEIEKETRRQTEYLLKHGRRVLAEALSQLTRRYDRLFDVSFPYSMGFRQKPADGAVHSEWQMHAHFYPPLLRSATVKKFMVGFEMLGSPQRDLTPEAAAARLREA